jgi:hypothetical protein
MQLPSCFAPLVPAARQITAGFVLWCVVCCACPSRAGADGGWSLLSDPATAPQRRDHAWIYDPLRDRLLIFGGSLGQPTDGLYALTLSPTPRWDRLDALNGGPVPYEGQQAIYDPVRDRMILFGGYYNCDVWALSLSGVPTWTRIEPVGPSPPGRVRASAVYDPVRDQLIVFGGSTYSYTPPSYTPIYFNDAWALPLGIAPVWEQWHPSGALPAGRDRHCAVYDPARDRMIVYGGTASPYGTGYFADAWSLSLTGTRAWTPLDATGPLPAARARATLTLDPPMDRLILHGGETSGHALLGDTWTLPLSAPPEWHALTPANPPAPRAGFAAAFDPARQRILVHGGAWSQGVDDATFSLSLNGAEVWSRVVPGAPPPAPAPRPGASAVYDSKRHRVIVHGGAMRPGDVATWAFDPADLTWMPILSDGPEPPARARHSAIYDPVGDRMIVFGGAGSLSDAWSLDFDPSPTWSALPQGPSGREQAAAVYDPVRRRMILSGGLVIRYSDQDSCSGQIWTLSLDGPPVWSQLPRHPHPPGLYAHSMIYDPSRDRVLTIGGSSKSPGNVIVRSLDHRIFALPLAGGSAWSELPSDGSVAERAQATLYDPFRDRLVMMGGSYFGGGQSDSVWVRSAGDAGVWAPLPSHGVHPALGGVASVFDPSSDRVLVVMSSPDPAVEDADQTWSLGFTATTAVPPADPGGISMGRPSPHPVTGETSIAFTLPDGRPARLEALDVTGRRVWSREVGAFGGGSHTLRISRVTFPAPGLYFLRLTREGRSVQSRLVVIR